MCVKLQDEFANSVDPDQTPRSAASDLGLHCLLGLVSPNMRSKHANLMKSNPLRNHPRSDPAFAHNMTVNQKLCKNSEGDMYAASQTSVWWLHPLFFASHGKCGMLGKDAYNFFIFPEQSRFAVATV